MRFIGPQTDTAATDSPGLPIGAATQPNPRSDSSRSKATPCALTLVSSLASWELPDIEYLVLRARRSTPGSSSQKASIALPTAVQCAGWRPPTRVGIAD